MPIQINAPEVEQRLQKEASRHGVTAADYALQILHQHLPEEGEDGGSSSKMAVGESLSVGTTIEARKSRFHRWVQSHNDFPRLSPQTFDRASFYEGHPA